MWTNRTINVSASLKEGREKHMNSMAELACKQMQVLMVQIFQSTAVNLFLILPIGVSE